VNTLGARIRPVIGTQTPPNGTHFRHPTNGGISGSWAAAIQGGTIPVKLQVAPTDEASPGSFSFQTYQGACTWTLTVFPDAQSGVPAVGSIGLVVLVALLLGVGALIITHRRRASVC